MLSLVDVTVPPPYCARSGNAIRGNMSGRKPSPPGRAGRSAGPGRSYPRRFRSEPIAHQKAYTSTRYRFYCDCMIASAIVAPPVESTL